MGEKESKNNSPEREFQMEEVFVLDFINENTDSILSICEES